MVLECDNVFKSTAEDAADEYFTQEAEQALRPRIVVKASNQSRTNSTVLTNDTELFMSLSAQCTYEFELIFLCSTNNSYTPGIKATFTGPTGSTGYFYVDDFDVGVASDNYWYNTISGVVGILYITALTDTITGAAIDDTFGTRVRGWIKTGNTTGNLQFQFAQDVSNANSTTVYAGSYLKVTRQ